MRLTDSKFELGVPEGEGPDGRREGPQTGWAPGRRRPPSAGSRRSRREPAFRPFRHRRQHGIQRPAASSQAVAHAHGWSRVDQSFNEPLRLKLAEAFCQHAIADSRDAGEQLIETSRSWQERFYDCTGPALSNQLDSALKGRAVVEPPSDHGERFYSQTDVFDRAVWANFEN